MPYKSNFTGAQIDQYITTVQGWSSSPDTRLDGVSGDAILNSVTGDQIMAKLTGDQIIAKLTGEQIMSKVSEAQLLAKLTGQGLIDKINTVTGNIAFKKFVDCQAGGGKTI